MTKPIRISNDYERKQAIELISKLDLQRAWRVTIVQWREKRSLDQNALAHRWFQEAADYFDVAASAGYKPAEVMKEYFKRKFLPSKEILIKGTPVLVPPQTSKLDMGEMIHFMTQVDDWCAQRGCPLTKPENSQYIELMREQEK